MRTFSFFSQRSPRQRGLATVVSAALIVSGVSAVAFAADVAAAPKAEAAAPAPIDLGDHPQDEAAALAQAHGSGERVEVVSERTPTATVWANPNGMLSKDITNHPVRVQQKDGSWAAVNTGLAAAGGGTV
ncbi:hypothetical protein ACIB24_20900 [Spongisporangium articulatum]|uniref:Uncharacterized protein n=1 Tax=Spongisporangium articulatum TaxID=3362603 RepID=A0ABW8AV70_9ACTN